MCLKGREKPTVYRAPMLKLSALAWALLTWWNRRKKETWVLKLIWLLYICYKIWMYLWAIFSLSTIFSWRSWFTLIERSSWKQSYCLNFSTQKYCLERTQTSFTHAYYLLDNFYAAVIVYLSSFFTESIYLHFPLFAVIESHPRESQTQENRTDDHHQKNEAKLSIKHWRIRQWHWDWFWS